VALGSVFVRELGLHCQYYWANTVRSIIYHLAYGQGLGWRPATDSQENNVTSRRK